jgi:hypothetical protein
MLELINLWKRTLGALPAEQQFVIWTESHPADIVRQAILKTATKNQTMGGTMSEDHRVRFASRVMLTLSAQRKEHAENRKKLADEFDARLGESATRGVNAE